MKASHGYVRQQLIPKDRHPAHAVYYPKNQLVCYKAMEFLYLKELRVGCNGIVAIAFYTGYNQEDSTIWNSWLRKSAARRNCTYEKLYCYGLVKLRATVSGDDIIIEKTALIKSALGKEVDIMGETRAMAAWG